jgi:hypothetical protein
MPRAKPSAEVRAEARTIDVRADRDLSPEAQRKRAETSRLRVQTSELIDRLQRHALGKVAMTPTQVQAAQTLLRKTLPDLIGVKAEMEFSPVVFNFQMGVPVVAAQAALAPPTRSSPEE